MRSMILISPSKNEIFSLYRQWSDKAKNVFKSANKLNMVLAGERIYIDYLEDGQLDIDSDGKIESKLRLEAFDFSYVNFGMSASIEHKKSRTSFILLSV